VDTIETVAKNVISNAGHIGGNVVGAAMDRVAAGLLAYWRIKGGQVNRYWINHNIRGEMRQMLGELKQAKGVAAG
jgi:hypothetical protein